MAPIYSDTPHASGRSLLTALAIIIAIPAALFGAGVVLVIAAFVGIWSFVSLVRSEARKARRQRKRQ